MGQHLFNTTIAAAIADRLVENYEILLLDGDSLRKPSKTPDPPSKPRPTPSRRRAVMINRPEESAG